MSDRIGIIGAGINGLATAWELAEAGYEVTVYDRNPENSESTSTGNAGMIVPSHFTPMASPGMLHTGMNLMYDRGAPFNIKWSFSTLRWMMSYLASSNRRHVEQFSEPLSRTSLRSRAWIADLAGKLGCDFGFETRGLVMACETANGFREEQATAERARTLGLSVEVLSADEVSERLGVETQCVGGVLFLDDAWVHPGHLVTALRQALPQRGVAFEQQLFTGRWNVTGKTANPADSGFGKHRAFVVAAGAQTSRLVARLDRRVKVLAGKGFGFTASACTKTSLCGLLAEARVAFTPRADGMRFTSGMFLGDDGLEIDNWRVLRMRESIRRVFPVMAEELKGDPEIWVGHRPCSPTGLPWIRTTARAKNVVVNSGQGMMGMTLAGMSGRVSAHLIAAGLGRAGSSSDILMNDELAWCDPRYHDPLP